MHSPGAEGCILQEQIRVGERSHMREREKERLEKKKKVSTAKQKMKAAYIIKKTVASLLGLGQKL